MESGRRRTAAGAAFVGTLGLLVLPAPVAHAADTGITVSDIVINNGKPIVVGTSKAVEPPRSSNIALPSGYSTADPYRYDAAREYETRSQTVRLKRAAKVTTADATPEPVTKGKKTTVTGKLTRANWSTKKHNAYSDRTVSLQFRATGTDSYKTVKKATTSSTGALKAPRAGRSYRSASSQPS
ncbi:hypothetical protein ACFY6Y_14145 [Streptomyces sp. NPDC012829]|uniref:hypothetical protein n=1 Tax=unclassified Streptomyces TaxID=2593676 RepID=UPI00368033D6